MRSQDVCFIEKPRDVCISIARIVSNIWASCPLLYSESMAGGAGRRLGLTTKLYTINPKDRSVVELYGVLDPNTRDWTDGLLSNIFREINRPTEKNERKYFVFDGDVDALWVENMNSVMDDNRLLTLANGERIRLQRHCALLFEVGAVIF